MVICPCIRSVVRARFSICRYQPASLSIPQVGGAEVGSGVWVGVFVAVRVGRGGCVGICVAEGDGTAIEGAGAKVGADCGAAQAANRSHNTRPRIECVITCASTTMLEDCAICLYYSIDRDYMQFDTRTRPCSAGQVLGPDPQTLKSVCSIGPSLLLTPQFRP